MLKLMPSTDNSSTVDDSTAGTTIRVMTVILTLRRNASSTSPASTTPIRTASRTLLAEPRISSLWSYQLLILQVARQLAAIVVDASP